LPLFSIRPARTRFLAASLSRAFGILRSQQQMR
jgi:hypothetical protein